MFSLRTPGLHTACRARCDWSRRPGCQDTQFLWSITNEPLRQKLVLGEFSGTNPRSKCACQKQAKVIEPIEFEKCINGRGPETGPLPAAYPTQHCIFSLCMPWVSSEGPPQALVWRAIHSFDTPIASRGSKPPLPLPIDLFLPCRFVLYEKRLMWLADRIRTVHTSDDPPRAHISPRIRRLGSQKSTSIFSFSISFSLVAQ